MMLPKSATAPADISSLTSRTIPTGAGHEDLLLSASVATTTLGLLGLPS
jgi:hypothetical protein